MKLSTPSHTTPEAVGLEVRHAIIEGAPFVHVTNLPFVDMEPVESERYIMDLSRAIGTTTLTAHIPDSFIWRLDSTTSPNSTFIPYHTDNPFLTNPERVVSFWSVTSSNQGGENLILPVDDFSTWASANPEYADMLQEIEESPVLFKHNEEFAEGPLIDRETSSARFDMKYIDEPAREIGLLLRKILADPSVPARQVKLSRGDALFFDNVKTLHARNEYSDPNRVNLRVRMASLGQ